MIDFHSAIRASGMSPPDVIEPGRFVRFPGVGKRNGNRAGWAKLFPDGAGGIFGDFATDFSEQWRAHCERPLTLQEREGLRVHIDRARAEADAERRNEQEDAARHAGEILQTADRDPASHPYAITKAVDLGPLVKRGAWPQRGWSDALLIPIYSGDGRVWSIEAINGTPDGDGKFQKDYLRHGRKSGCFHPIGKLRGAAQVLVGEGLATVASAAVATGLPVVAAMDAGNLLAVSRAVRELAPDADLVLLADNDIKPDGSNPGLTAATQAAVTVGAGVAIPEMDGRKCDFWDLWHEQGAEAVKQAAACAMLPDVARGQPIVQSASEADLAVRFRTVTMLELVNTELPQPDPLLAPWLCSRWLAQVHAWRGTGKTHFSLGVAYAVATGGKFLRWAAPAQNRVLFIDGEMPAVALQERLKAILEADDRDIDVSEEMLRFITPDLLEGAPPDLASSADQERLQQVIDALDPRLIVVDNISTLVRSGGAENDAEAWIPIQSWALKMRREGRAVLFVHHTGKGGKQRGTSKREDVLDAVISLRRPEPYDPADGARFIVEFEKARHLRGDDAKSFEAKLGNDAHGRQDWTTTDIEQSTVDRVVALHREGVTKVHDLAEELGVNKSTASRALRKAKAAGLIVDKETL